VIFAAIVVGMQHTKDECCGLCIKNFVTNSQVLPHPFAKSVAKMIWSNLHSSSLEFGVGHHAPDEETKIANSVFDTSTFESFVFGKFFEKSLVIDVLWVSEILTKALDVDSFLLGTCGRIISICVGLTKDRDSLSQCNQPVYLIIILKYLLAVLLEERIAVFAHIEEIVGVVVPLFVGWMDPLPVGRLYSWKRIWGSSVAVMIQSVKSIGTVELFR